MSRLDVAIQGVPADSPSADQIEDQNTDPSDAAEPTQPEGDTGDTGDGKGDGRSIENVRGELLRKLEKSNNEIMEELRSIREQAQQNAQQYGTPAPQNDNPQTLDDMSVAQLEAARVNVPEESLAQFDAYLLQRKVDAKVDERLQQFETQTQNHTAEQRFNEQAVQRWPQLRDKTSELYRKADRILSEMGEAANHPRAVLNAANEAGLELGMSPSTGLLPGGTRREPGRVAPGRRSSAPPGRDSNDHADEHASIAASLASAMPGGKFTEEQMKRIAERDKLYRDTIDQRVK